jgi:hypothetical protein
MAAPSIDDLRGEHYELLDVLDYDDLIPFAARYFFERTSWITWTHHVLSLAALISIFVFQNTGLWRGLAQFLAGFVVMFVVFLPLHEALHALAYRLAGAREIRWKMMWRYLAAYVVAERFVSGRAVFFFVALAPFIVITPLLIFLAVTFPEWSVLWLTVLFWHTAGVSGDWALMNYYWIHRPREIYSWDESGRSWFYTRKMGSHPIL